MTDHVSRRPTLTGRNALFAAALGLLVVGGGAGALAVEATRPSVTMAPATPVAIRSLVDSGRSFGRADIVTIRGRVAEIYGSKFVMADASGRALVDLGREGEDRALVTAGAPVTVQGRFDHGFLHAAFLVGVDGKVVALGPLGGPPHGHGRDHEGDHDRDHEGRGPDRGPEGGPNRGPGAPPPPAPVAAAPAAAATK